MRTTRDADSPICVDLFCGAGGATTGITHAGFHLASGVDVDEDALAVYRANHDHPAFQHDLADVDTTILPDAAHNAVYVHGSPPCKGFSTVGERSTTDARNSLVISFVEWVAAIAPTIVTLENVPAMRSMKDARGENVMDEVHARFDAAGYDSHDVVLEAADYGVPQLRQRLYVFAAKRGSGIDPASLVPEPTTPEPVGLADALTDASPEMYQTSQPSETHQLRGDRRIRQADEPAYTIRGGTPSALLPESFEPGSAEYMSDVESRRLTETELAVLQSFPEDYDWGDHTKTRTRELLGNAVPPLLAEAVAEQVREALEFAA